MPKMMGIVSRYYIKKAVRVGKEGKLKDMSPVELQKVRRDLEKKIRQGIPREDIIEDFVHKYECTNAYAKVYYCRAMKQINAYYKKYAEETARINNARLDQIIMDNMENGNGKVAIMAIAEQNKLAHLYDNELKIKQDGPITVTFG